MTIHIEVPKSIRIPARKMTLEAMELDFTYRIAQKLCKTILDEGLVSLEDYEIISTINQNSFSPFFLRNIALNCLLYRSFRANMLLPKRR